MKFCQHCGAQNAPDAVFCCGCGARMDAPGPSTSYGHPGYGQPVYNQPTYASTGAPRRPIQTDRSLFMYILLTIVTCGIYGYVFIYKLAQDTNDMCFEDGEKTAGLGMYLLLSIVTCGFYSYYWLYKVQNRFQAAGMRYGVPITENGTTVLMWYLFGALLCGIGPFIAMNIILTTANKLATAYNMKYCYNR
ncbi:MAG: DUF4234 domain-containing protein [Ruminococcaceae bacterium]|nr:DUF4234 domain-containing protein [Oscillospiraceae bacterium]